MVKVAGEIEKVDVKQNVIVREITPCSLQAVSFPV